MGGEASPRLSGQRSMGQPSSQGVNCGIATRWPSASRLGDPIAALLSVWVAARSRSLNAPPERPQTDPSSEAEPGLKRPSSRLTLL